MFQQMMASLLGTKRQLEGGRVLRREGSVPAGSSKLGRLLWPMLRASVALAAFFAVASVSAGLNDTGITSCGDATRNGADCATVSGDNGSSPRQDARYGRDAQSELLLLTKSGGGGAGFDFSRITNNGAVKNNASLGSGNSDWACTYDHVTGLTWEVKTTSGLSNKNHTFSWYSSNGGVVGTNSGGTCETGGRCDTEKFVADVNNAGLCGYSDWRLPTLKELENIVDYSRINPPIDPDYFINTRPDQYWTSTADSSYPGQYMWLVDFMTGAAAKDQPAAAQSVRLVRGAASQTNQFTVTDQGLTVTDASTGLVWKRNYEMVDPSNPGTWQDRIDTFTWTEALGRPLIAANAGFAGYSDWRLPNVKELRSLVSETRHNPAIDTSVFPATPFQSDFWTASPNLDYFKNQDKSWGVSFDIGMSFAMPRSFRNYVRLVRGGDAFDNRNTSISIDASLISFSPQILGTSSAPRVVTLSNFGAGAINNISISTPGGDYPRTTNCGATLNPGQSCAITVTFTPTAEGVRANAITIASSATSQPLSVTLSGKGLAAQYGLTVTKAGTGSGAVGPVAVDCGGPVCSTNYPTFTDVTLTATAAAGSTFMGWSELYCTEASTCVVSMTEARNITAVFSDNSLITYALTVTKAGTGSGTVGPFAVDCGSTICSTNYVNGSIVTLTAEAASGSTFSGWSGANCSGTGPCVVTMTQARSVTATFAGAMASSYALTVTKAGNGSGTVTPAAVNCGSTICSANYPSSSSVTLTATATSGSTFSGWSGENCSGTSSTCVVSMTQARSVTATFASSTANGYALTITRLGTGSGTADSVGKMCIGFTCSPVAAVSHSCTGTKCTTVYPKGTTVTLTAAAASGSTFSGWGGGTCSGGNSTCVVSMTQAFNVTATFGGSSSYALTVTKAGTGSGTVGPVALNCGSTICSSNYTSGASVTLTATAASGSTFSGWSEANCSGTGSTCVVSMTLARNVIATFESAPISAPRLYDGIYQWDEGAYLSVHQLKDDTVIASIYWVFTSNTVQVDNYTVVQADTFDLFDGKISGSDLTISGTGFYEACKLSYDLKFNSDSSLAVRLKSVSNAPGVTVDCAARYRAVGSEWTIFRVL